MKKRSRFTVIGLIGVFAILVIYNGWVRTPPAASAPKLPNPLIMTSYGVGTAVFVVSSAIAEGITKLTGVTVRVLPTSTDVSRFVPLKERKAQAMILSSLTHYDAIRGEGPTFGEWGPVRLRALWHCYDIPMGLAARGDSGLKTPADLKGKRISRLAGVGAQETNCKGHLAFYDLTLKDVVEVWISGDYGQLYGSVLDKKVDFGMVVTGSAPVLEMAATCGINWFQMPPSDLEGWKRLKVHMPWMVPLRFTRGSGASPERPIDIGACPMAIYCYDFLDDDTTYAITKTFHEAYPYYKDKHYHAVEGTLKNTLKDWSLSPFHTGAIKYFKDIGEWNSELETMQQEKLGSEQNRIRLWEERRKVGEKK